MKRSDIRNGSRRGGREALIALALTLVLASKALQLFMQYMPAPLTQTLAAEFRLPFVRLGLLISVCTVTSGVATFLASGVNGRIGAFRAWCVGILFSAVGGIGSALTTRFEVMVLMYVLLGVGAGFAICLVPVLVAQLLPVRLYSPAMSVNLAAHNLFVSAAYILPGGVMRSTGMGWRSLIGGWGMAELVFVLLILLFRRRFESVSLELGQDAPESGAVPQGPEEGAKRSGLWLAAHNRVVLGLTAMMTFLIWSNKTISAYLPVYLVQSDGGMDAAAADAISATISAAAVFGALILGGLGKNYSRPILYAAPFLAAVGGVGLFLAPVPWMITVCAGMFGFFYQGWIPVALSELMSIGTANPQLTASAVALFNCLGHIITIFIPITAELLLSHMSLQMCMLTMQAPLILSVCAALFVPILRGRKGR